MDDDGRLIGESVIALPPREGVPGIFPVLLSPFHDEADPLGCMAEHKLLTTTAQRCLSHWLPQCQVLVQPSKWTPLIVGQQARLSNRPDDPADQSLKSVICLWNFEKTADDS